MKVLFAVNNDNVSETIVKEYQKQYKEILSYKNVYYFNAILRELQKDKSYSRIIISEDLEPFANNNYNSIDKFLFEKYNSITEEAKSPNDEPIDIILICADRRRKLDDAFVKLYKQGIYSAIIGEDRNINEICRLINNPRSKESAKRYYNIQESELGETESENSVSEAEVQNILAHYKRLGKNEDKYLESFNNIVSQYTDYQLKIIIKYLPMNVKAVLESRSPKYQQLSMNYGVAPGSIDMKKKAAEYKAKLKEKEEYEEKNEIQQLIKAKPSRDIVIPQKLETQTVQKIEIPNIVKPEIGKKISFETDDLFASEPEEEFNVVEDKKNAQEELSSMTDEPKETIVPQKKGRGRPRKNPLPVEGEEKVKRGRGRPKKQPDNVEEAKKVEKNSDEEIDLFNLENENNKSQEVDLFNIEPEENKPSEIDLFSDEIEPSKPEEVDLFNMEPEKVNSQSVDLFDMEDSKKEDIDLFNIANSTEQPKEESIDLFELGENEDNESELFNMEPKHTQTNNQEFSNPNRILSIKEQNETYENAFTRAEEQEQKNEEFANSVINTNSRTDANYRALLTSSKKVVAFVGTTKNGTSFIVNNTAEMLASMGIETVILDMTKTKNAYYIYTNNEESLRMKAKECMEKLENGITEGIKVKKNLTVYTEMPGDEREYDIGVILSTLLQSYSAILIDTDFDTPDEIFEKAQEIYLVQTMDVLTIQPLTAFLRNLKSRNVLVPEKLKIVINKSERVKSLNVKTLIGGMSCYNSPNMTYMTELFNKDNIRYCEIPFEVQNYVKYLDSLVNCSISLNGYTKQFIASLKQLVSMVYPLINKQGYTRNK